MGEKLAEWYRDQGEYITGGLFALITLDIFMFFVHVITERTPQGYDLTTLMITVSLGIVAGAERLYAQQEAH